MPIAGVALLGASQAFAAGHAGAAMLDEKDPTAVGLAYVADAAKADKAKVKAPAGSNCANCALYSGKAGDAAGGCGIFPGKQVAAKGICSAWAKKG
ncbi:MAG: high-potential iron-sulfur protein [Pseudomonadota bacterium]